MKTKLFSLLILLTFSCSKEENKLAEAYLPNATILSRGIDCNNSYLIKFNDNLTGIPTNSTNNVFYAINLPNQYKINNLTLNVTFRLPTNEETMFCTTLGITYPQIYIETATNQ